MVVGLEAPTENRGRAEARCMVIASNLDIALMVDPTDVAAVVVVDASRIAEPAPGPSAQRANLGSCLNRGRDEATCESSQDEREERYPSEAVTGRGHKFDPFEPQVIAQARGERNDKSRLPWRPPPSALSPRGEPGRCRGPSRARRSCPSPLRDSRSSAGRGPPAWTRSSRFAPPPSTRGWPRRSAGLPRRPGPRATSVWRGGEAGAPARGADHRSCRRPPSRRGSAPRPRRRGPGPLGGGAPPPDRPGIRRGSPACSAGRAESRRL